MADEPRIEQRPARPDAGVRRTTTMDGIAAAAEDAYPAVFAWLEARGTPPAGPSFIRYRSVVMDRELELDLAVPVAETFMVRSSLHRGDEVRAAWVRGRDIYAVTAPIVVEAMERSLSPDFDRRGVVSVAQAVDATRMLATLAADGQLTGVESSSDHRPGEPPARATG